MLLKFVQNKLVRNILLLLFCFTFLSYTSAIFTALGDSQTLVYISPENQTVNIGDDVYVEIKVNDVNDLSSAQISLEYNQNILEYKNVEQGEFLKRDGHNLMQTFPILSNGKIVNYALGRPGDVAGISGSGVIAVFVFRAKQNGISNIRFINNASSIEKTKLKNSIPETISISLQNGRITVGSGGTEPPDDPPVPTEPPEAEFNSVPGTDKKTLRLKNRTTNTYSWQSSVSASPGDEIALNVYYHNVVEESTAKNTKIRLNFSQTAQSKITVTAYLSADNAETVIDTAVINLPSPQTIIFPSYAQWYPNQKTSNPNSRSLSKTSSSVEVNIGNIKGCWEYQGQVIFEAEMSNETPQARLSLYSRAKNLSEYNPVWNTNLTARPYEEIYFETSITALDYDSHNVVIKNILPAELEYQQDTLYVSGTSNWTGDLFGSTGMKIPKINKNSSVKLYYKAKVKTTSIGQTTARNKVYIKADGISEVKLDVIIDINNTGCSPSLRGPGPDVA